MLTTYNYNYDDAYRLISITDKTSGHLSQFTYDGFSRLIVRKEYTSADASPTETHYLWCGDFICQTRDASDTITARHYSQGELQGNSALYYNTNHLGSVLGLLDAQGKSLGQTSYGPYGEPEQTQGKTSDYRYAGMYYHASTGLYLTHYRFYDPQSGRWLNRDPIEEKGGVNLYAYVGGNPVNLKDPLGLAPGDHYPDKTAAAVQAIKDVNPTSIREGREYAGRIYQLPDGSYSYTKPNPGTADHSYPGQCPSGTKNAGDYHTHGSDRSSV